MSAAGLISLIYYPLFFPSDHAALAIQSEEFFFEPNEAAGAPVVAWFWAVLEEDCTPEQRAGVLQFATGCGRVPVGGFAALTGFNGAEHAFTLSVLPLDARNATVKAATCFNELRVQRYAGKAALRARLLSAIANREGFNEHAVAH